MKGLPLFSRPPDRSRVGRFVARVSGLACGLALAVRPAGSAETSGVNGALELSAWELACHALLTTVFAGQGLLVLPVDDRHRPSQTLASGTQRARCTPETVWMQTTGACLFVFNQCSLPRVQMHAQDSRSAHGLLDSAGLASE